MNTEFLTVHYICVVTKQRKLKGVIRLRDLVFADPNQSVGDIARPALTVAPEASLDELVAAFSSRGRAFESCPAWRASR